MKIANRLNELKLRGKPKATTKYEQTKDDLGRHLTKKEKPKKLYEYYICDYCNEEIRIANKWENEEGGVCKIPQSLSNIDGTIYLTLHTKCLKHVIEEFEAAKRKGKLMKEINIEDYLSSTRYTTRQELCQRTGLSDRKIRDKISVLKTKRVVIYSSGRSGYRLAKEIGSMSDIELEEEIRQVEHSLNDCKSRTKQINKQKRKYIAYLKKVEQIKLERENYSHIPRID